MLSKNRNSPGLAMARSSSAIAPNSQIRRSPQRLEPVTARILPPTSSACSTKGGFGLLQRLGEDRRGRSSAPRASREDVGDAHLLEAHLLHGEEGVEQRVRLGLGPGLDAAEAADRLELARLRTMLLALALAARAAEQRVEAAVEVDGQREVRARQMRQREQRICDAADLGRQAFQRDACRYPAAPGGLRRVTAAHVGSRGASGKRSAVIAGKLPLAWCPPMKRGDAERSAARRPPARAQRPAARHASSVATTMIRDGRRRSSC